LLVGLWFAVSVILSAFHVFRNDSGVGVAVAIGAGVPIALFALWFAFSESFREFTRSLNPRILTLVQSWRIAGFVFVVLEAYRILPAMFALPAGYGDMFIGATAPLAAFKLASSNRRGAFIFWQLLGMIDLVTAVSLGVTSRILNPQGVSMLPMTELPLSVIPTFIVPLLFIFHVISIANARRWSDHKVSAMSAGNPARVVA